MLPAAGNIRVLVRIRPHNKTELMEKGATGRSNVLSLDGPKKSSINFNGDDNDTGASIIVNSSTVEESSGFRRAGYSSDGENSSSTIKKFMFDAVHDPRSTQNEVYESVRGTVDAVTAGYNGTIVAYGQTGSGKTHTVFGDMDSKDDTSAGLIQRSLREIFQKIALMQAEVATGQNSDEFFDDFGTISTTFRGSFFEIFNERVYDLLSNDSLEKSLAVREDGKGVYVKGLKEVEVENTCEVEQLLSTGLNNRKVAATNMNRTSSRSHAVFGLTVKIEHTSQDGLKKVRTSKFTLVDLAGSERQKSTAAYGNRLKEASMINNSLLNLGHVINALADKENGKVRHVPFRNSKLTFLLRDTWGGNSKTCLVATVSPSGSALSETVSTLNFAQRAKLIKNKAVLNENTCGTLAALQAEISRLKSELEQKTSQPKSCRETEIQYDQTDEVAAIKRRADRADEMIKHLENKVTQEGKVVNTLKRKVQEETMVRKFKQRRLDYIQRKHNDKTEDDHVSILREEVLMLQKQLATPSPEAVEWKMAYEDLKEDLEKRKKDGEVDVIELQKQNSDLEATVQRLVTSKIELEERRSELTKRSFERQDEIDSILKEVDRLESETISLQDELEDKKNHLEKCEKRADDADLKSNQMEVEINKAKDDLSQIKGERDKLQQEGCNLSIEVTLLKEAVEEKNKKINEIEKLSKEYENELLYTIDELGKKMENSSSATLADIDAKVALLQQHLDEAVEEKETMQKELDVAASTIASHESKIRELEQRMVTLTSEKQDAYTLSEQESDAHNTLKKKTMKLEEDLVTITSEKNTLESSLSNVTFTLREESKKIRELEEKIQESEIEKNKILQQLDSNSCQIFDNNKIIEVLQIKIDSLTTEKESYLLSFQEEKEALEMKFKDELKKIEDELMQVEKEKSELHICIESLQLQKEATMKEVEALRTSLEEAEAKLESSEEASSSLLQSVKEESDDLEKGLYMKITSLEEERQGFCNKITELEDSFIKIKDNEKKATERILERDDEISSLKLKILGMQEDFNASSEEAATKTNLLRDQLKLTLVGKTSLEKSLNEMKLTCNSISKELSEQIRLTEQKDLKYHEAVKNNSTSKKSHEDEITLHHDKYDTLRTDFEQIKLRLDTSQDANTDLKDKYEVLVKEQFRLEKQAQDYEDRKNEALIDATNKEAELNEEHNTMLLEKENKIATLEKKLQLAQSEILIAQTESKASILSEEKSSRNLMEYKDRIVLLKREKASIEFELETLQEDQNTLSEQLRNLGAENDTLSIENRELKGLIEKMKVDNASSVSIAESSLNIHTNRESSSHNSNLQYHHQQNGTPDRPFKDLSSKMDSMLKRVSNAHSPDQNLSADDSFDESMFLPNSDKDCLVQDVIIGDVKVDRNKENQVIATDNQVPTPSKYEYGIKRKPLSVKKINMTPSRSPLGSTSKKRKGLSYSSNNQKQRSNWMVFDNKRLFEK